MRGFEENKVNGKRKKREREQVRGGVLIGKDKKEKQRADKVNLREENVAGNRYFTQPKRVLEV